MSADLHQKKLEVLYEFSRLVGEALDLSRTLNRMLGVLSDTLRMRRATVTLLDAASGALAIRASHGLTPLEIERGIYKSGEGITGRIFEKAKPFVIPDIRREPLFLNRTGARRIERDRIAFLGVPILLKGKPIGVLHVDRLFGDDVSYEEDVAFLTIVAALIAQLVFLNREVEERQRSLVLANQSLKEEISEKYDHFFMVGSGPAMREVRQIAGRVAASSASVLLLGESGTGKTLVARILHEMSPRASNPFVKLNCAALPETLLESELFGYERGAFTGAERPKPGRIEQAEGGTLFLDEIGELPLLLQTKLLRFLQEREFERLGSNQTRKANVRILSATNRDLARAAATGEFREDLYYRLNVVPVHVPALRERKEDIPLLLRHFLDRFGREYQKEITLAPRVEAALAAYSWPGNVREMENLIERLAILAERPLIDLSDLPPHLTAAGSAPPRPCLPGAEPPHTLEGIERQEILSALERNRWVQARAARELGITVRQLGYRMRKFGLERAR